MPVFKCDLSVQSKVCDTLNKPILILILFLRSKELIYTYKNKYWDKNIHWLLHGDLTDLLNNWLNAGNALITQVHYNYSTYTFSNISTEFYIAIYLNWYIYILQHLAGVLIQLPLPDKLINCSNQAACITKWEIRIKVVYPWSCWTKPKKVMRWAVFTFMLMVRWGFDLLCCT